MDNKNLEIKSDDVQEILGTPPSWLVQWGTILMALVLLGLTLVFWKLEYPDEVRGELVLRSSNQPEIIFAKIGGKVDEIFVKDKQRVQPGDELLVMQNFANYNDVIFLSENMDSVSSLTAQQLNRFSPPIDLELGELQEGFVKFKNQLSNYKESNLKYADHILITQHKQDIKFIEEEIESIEDRINRYILNKKKAESRRETLKEDLLNNRVTVRTIEDNNSRIEDIQDEIKTQRRTIQRKEQEIKKLKGQIDVIYEEAQGESKYELKEVQQSIELLSREIDIWKRNYILKSSIEGSIMLSNYFNPKKYYDRGKPVLAISTGRDSEINAFATIPVENYDEVKEGQKAHLKLSIYPSKNYGYIVGTVISKKTQHQEGNCLVQIQLDNGMTSSKGQDLIFEPNMIGQVEIITEDRNVLERLFGKASQLLF